MYNETITFYSKTPPNKWEMSDADITFWEENRTCGDDLKVFIKIQDDKITAWSFEWETAIITTACASIFWESIIGKNISEVFDYDLCYIEDLVWMPISKRRHQAAVLGLLTTRNAIHDYLGDGKHDTFDEVIV